ncbi:MAG: hypothetical protein V1862_12440 [Methanobacteriota archaeon]
MDFVRDVCDRCALMHFGKIVKIGLTAEVFDEVPKEEQTTMATE